MPGMEKSAAENGGRTAFGVLEFSLIFATLGPSAYVTRNVMGNLAVALAHEKREPEAVAVLERLVGYAAKAEGTAQSDAQYQYASGLAVLGHKDGAFEHLEKAIQAGFSNVNQLTSDDDLQLLRDDPRFQALITEIQKNQGTK